MSIKDIKDGDTVLVKAKVYQISENSIHVLRAGVSVPESLDDIYPLPTPPKYDPCRKFRKGDIVEPSVINGRLPEELQGCYRYEVIVGEGDMTNPLYVSVKPLLAANYKHLSEIHVNVVFLKLVTPVEARLPYCVHEYDDVYEVQKGILTFAAFYKTKYGDLAAKAAAEAECARLNAEWRKENNHDK